MFDHFVGLALKGLTKFQSSFSITNIIFREVKIDNFDYPKVSRWNFFMRKIILSCCLCFHQSDSWFACEFVLNENSRKWYVEGNIQHNQWVFNTHVEITQGKINKFAWVFNLNRNSITYNCPYSKTKNELFL